MNLFRRQLLATAAGLTMAFSAVTGAEAQQQQQETKAPATAQQTLTLQTVTSLYHTQDSKALAALEARLNQEKPANTPRVVYIDPDVMATWLQLKGNIALYPAMTAEYLSTKQVAQPDAQTLVGIANASMAMRPGSAVPQLAHPSMTEKELAQAACVVVPYNPNLSAQDFMRAAFDLGNPRTGVEENTLRGVALNISFTRQEMQEIINAREAWGCFDTHFAAQVNQTKDFDRIMALHRTEVFKDVGGMMQAVKDGADPSSIGKFADFRETVSAMTAHARGTLFTPTDMAFYGAVIYESSPALHDLQARIDQMGVTKFRALSGEDMVKLATDITQKSALTPEQGTHIMGYAMLGEGYFRSLQIAKADPAAIAAAKQAVVESLTRQNEAVKTSIRPMTPEEMEGQLVPLVTPDITYGYLQREIFSDKGVQKNPEDPAARLRVHQQLIERARDLMDKNPDKAGVIRQVLQGIFLSNPMMQKAPPVPAAPSGPPQRMLEA